MTDLSDLPISGAAGDAARSATLFVQQLIRVSELMSRRVANMFGESEGLKTVEVRILLTIAPSEALSIADVSRRTGLDKAWISRTIRALEKRELVEIGAGRHPAAKLVSLTGQGISTRARMTPRLYDEWIAITSGIDAVFATRMLDIVLGNLKSNDSRL